MGRVGSGILKNILNANSVLYAIADNVPAALSLAASRILGRKSSGDIAAMTAAELLTIINVASGADVTGSNAPQGHLASHANGGGDEVGIGGLSGLLADDQHVLDSEVTDVAIANALLTTRGDTIYRNATVPARLAKGNSGDVLTQGADDPAWAAPAAGGATVASGTYAGNESIRQITTGFKCSIIFVISSTGGKAFALAMESKEIQMIVANQTNLLSPYIHASDGIGLEAVSNELQMNKNSYNYAYWAISE